MYKVIAYSYSISLISLLTLINAAPLSAQTMISKTDEKKKTREIINYHHKLENVNIVQDNNTGIVDVSGNLKMTYILATWYEWEETWKKGKRTWTIEKKSREERTRPYCDIEADHYVFHDEWDNQTLKRQDKFSLSSNGDFRITMQSKQYQVPHNVNRKFESVEFHYRKVILKVNINYPHSAFTSTFDERIPIENRAIRVYYTDIKKEEIKKHIEQNIIRDEIILMKFRVKDFDSRTNVTANITLTCLSPETYIDNKLKNEFGKDYLVKEAKKQLMDNYDNMFFAGPERNRKGDYIYFYLTNGAKYRIETINSNYQYFSTDFIANPLKSEKTVLIVEKGVNLNINRTAKGKLIDN